MSRIRWLAGWGGGGGAGQGGGGYTQKDTEKQQFGTTTHGWVVVVPKRTRPQHFYGIHQPPSPAGHLRPHTMPLQPFTPIHMCSTYPCTPYTPVTPFPHTPCPRAEGGGVGGLQIRGGKFGVSIWPPNSPRQIPGLSASSSHPLVLCMLPVSFLGPCFRHDFPQPTLPPSNWLSTKSPPPPPVLLLSPGRIQRTSVHELSRCTLRPADHRAGLRDRCAYHTACSGLVGTRASQALGRVWRQRTVFFNRPTSGNLIPKRPK